MCGFGTAKSPRLHKELEGEQKKKSSTWFTEQGPKSKANIQKKEATPTVLTPPNVGGRINGNKNTAIDWKW
jgi:hypothetical protein